MSLTAALARRNGAAAQDSANGPRVGEGPVQARVHPLSPYLEPQGFTGGATIEQQMEQLHDHLSNTSNICGAWIRKPAHYEAELCSELGFTCESMRYWDCVFDGMHIEIKKGTSVWLDEVRYSEILLGDETKHNGCCQETITLFMIPSKDKERIETIHIVDTKNIIRFMQITQEWAETILAHRKRVRRQLNCQQSMAISDVRRLASFTITWADHQDPPPRPDSSPVADDQEPLPEDRIN